MAHLITTAEGPVTPIGIEHAAETVSRVRQAAAVGVGPIGNQQVVVVVAPVQPIRRADLADDDLADQVRSAVGVGVAAVLVVPGLPTDKRHNSKIERTRIARWAESVLAGGRFAKL
jgi:acyl-coenzyme A synthetase/AMP-(fatty) acid ligase